jgi:hypothetical protein
MNVAALLMLLVPGLASANASTFDPARVGWAEVRMTASKLFLTAEATVRLRTLPATRIVNDLKDAPGATPIAPGPDVLELVYDTRGAGRRSLLTLLMDPLSGAALQRTQVEAEGRFRQRIYRFGDLGAYQRSRYPASNAEKRLPPARWTDTSEDLRRYPDPPAGRPVVEPTGLLYLVAAADLDQSGDSLEVLVFRRRDTQVVRIEVVKPKPVDVHYDELWPMGTIQRREQLQPIRLILRGLPQPGAAAGEDDQLELLGLRGRLELLLDPVTRAPLQLSGNVKVIGTVTLKLAAVRPR